MLREVLDQRFGEFGPIPGQGHRQIKTDRRTRLWLDGQTMPPIHPRKIEVKDGPTAHHAVIIARCKGLAHLPIKGGARLALNHFDRRCLIGEGLNRPCTASGPFNPHLTGSRDLELLLGIGAWGL